MNEIHSIWSEFHGALKGLVIKTVKDPNDADDILQDIFLKIMLHSEKIERAENLRHYLFGIARNATNDYFRHKKNARENQQIDDAISIEETAHALNAAIAECCVRNFVSKLPDKYREALMLTEFEDVSQKDLAQRLGISYSGAKSRVQRGKEKLKELILACCAFESDRYGNVRDTENKNCSC